MIVAMLQSSRRRVLLATCVWLGGVVALSAQEKGKDDKEVPKPVAVDFDTEDGVRLAGTYFKASTGKDAAPVILLHAQGRGQRDFDDLAYTLQENGYAVVSFDFRGHSNSKNTDPAKYRDPQTNQPAKEVRYDARRWRARDYERLSKDVDAAKRFLVRRHNDGECNIAKLAIVGAEVGATVATLFGKFDWEFEPVGGGDKQGQDVTAIVLISPTLNFEGLKLVDPLQGIKAKIPLLFLVGSQDRKATDQAKRAYQMVRAAHNRSAFKEFGTSVQGSALLDVDLKLGADKEIVQFLDKASKAQLTEWKKRELLDSN